MFCKTSKTYWQVANIWVRQLYVMKFPFTIQTAYFTAWIINFKYKHLIYFNLFGLNNRRSTFQSLEHISV